MNFDYREFLAGCFGGTLGITLSYPVDTYKTLCQTRQPIRFSNLYAGYSAPLLGMMAEKSVLFWGYDLVRKNTGLGEFGSGVGAGLMTTVVVTPFERIKIRAQTTGQSASKTLIKTLRNDGMISMYRGWTATLGREVPGYGIYFTTYKLAKRYFNRGLRLMELDPNRFSYHLLGSAVSGSLSGITAWAFIYPSDPVKTVAQNENISTTMAAQRIWRTEGLRGFYAGFTPALIRAGILHCGVFLGYELGKIYLNTKTQVDNSMW